MDLDKSLSDIIRSKGNGRRHSPYKKRNGRRNGYANGNGRANGRRRRQYRDNNHLSELKVSAATDPKKLAGKLNNIVLNGDPPQIFSIGTFPTNQAIKAIAISRRNVRQEKIDLLVQPRFQRGDDIAQQDADAYIFSLRKGPARPPREDSAVLKVSGSGDAGKIAGAIANKIRGGDRVALEGIGPIAVNVSVKSIVHARKYLIDDGMDLGFRPEFQKFEIKGDEKIGMHFELFASQT